MFEDIRKNKIKTAGIVGIFILIITIIIYYTCIAFNMGEFSIIIALAFSILSTFATYYNCDKIVLASCNARPATKEEDLKLVNILDALVISAGLTIKPRLYVVEDAQPNAFATGRNPENSVICVTTGLLDKLEYYELEGVIAHELGHIKNYDIRLSAVISVMVGFVVMITDWLYRSFLWHDFDDDDNNSNGIITLVGIFLIALSPIFAKLLQLAVSRRREFLADATAIELTRNPDGLISALQKLDADQNELRTASSATAHMYITEPFKNNAQNKRKHASWFSTHPSIDDRIDALRNIK